MCERNEDLQEAWKPSEGSWVKRIDFKDPYVLDYDADRTICYAFDCDWIKKINPNPDFIKWYDQRGENYVIYLPTQEQLQEMIKDKWINDITMLFAFKNWVEEDLYDNKSVLMATEYMIVEFLLAFVMKEKYNKIWNGKDWKNE